MDLLKYITFSSLEYFSCFMFILVQFRFSLKESITQLMLISILLSFVSYSFVSAELDGLFPLIQFIFILLYIQFVLKVSFFNATIMFFTGYIVFGLVQTCVIAAAMHLGIHEDELQPGTNIAYVIQLISIILMSLFSISIISLKGGFSFVVARSRFSKKSIKGKNRMFILFIIFAFIVSIVANISMLEYKNPPYLIIASTLLILLLTLFYFSLRRDEVND